MPEPLETLQVQTVEYFQNALFPAYIDAMRRSGFRWDTLERRGGPKNVRDYSILSQVGWSYALLGALTGTADWLSEARFAANDLVAFQEPDGRWETPYVDAYISSLTDAFATADAVWFLGKAGFEDPALKGARWLVSGKVAYQVSPIGPLEALIGYNHNHVGTIIRALLATGQRDYIPLCLDAGLRLASYQRPCGSWYWMGGATKEERKITTNYHDLTVWGLADLYRVTQDSRLRPHLQRALEFVLRMMLSDGRVYNIFVEDTGQVQDPSFTGIVTLASCLGFGWDDQILPALLKMVEAVFEYISPSYLLGYTASSVEFRLIILRGLTQFLEHTTEPPKEAVAGGLLIPVLALLLLLGR